MFIADDVSYDRLFGLLNESVPNSTLLRPNSARRKQSEQLLLGCFTI